MPPKRAHAKKKPVKKAAPTPAPSLSAAELERLLQCMLAPDTAQITQATNILNEFLKHSSSVAAFMHVITASPQAEARQMSAVLLRRKIRVLWTGVDNQLKHQIQEALLQRLVNEPVRMVRRAVAALVSKIAQESIPRNRWPSLFDFLSQCCHSEFSEHREIGVMLFRALAESIPRQLVPHVSTLQQLFVNGVNDPHPRVRVESLYALDALCELLTRYDHQKLSELVNMIPPLVNLVQQFTHSTSSSSHSDQDDEIVSVVFEVFDTIVDSPAPIPDSHLSLLIPMMLTVATSTHYDLNLREQACGFIINFMVSHSKKLIKLGTIDMLLQAVFVLLCENKDVDDLQVLYENSASSLGVDLLHGIMENVPKTYTFNTVINTASQLMTDTAAPHRQKAGLLILAGIAEFCHPEMLPQLSVLVQAVSSFISHPTVLLRVAAWWAFAQFCEHLVPDLLAYHRTLLPLILQTLSNAQEHEAVRDKACGALEVFCEHLDQQDIRPYLCDIMTHLVTLLQSGIVAVQSSSLSAMNSVVEAAKKDFLPFFDVTIKLLAHMMSVVSDDENLLHVRGKATMCVGYVAAAVGKETFNPHLSTFLPLVISGTAMDSYYLRESSYFFFSNLADMLQEEFAPLLSTVLPLVLASLKSDDGLEVMKRGGGLSDDDEEHDAYGSELEDVGEEEEIDDEDEVVGTVNMQIRTGAKDEKVAALGCLATLFACVSHSLIPYIDACYEEIRELIYYPHPEIRSACVTAFGELVHWHHRVYDPELTWTRGQVIALKDKHQIALNKLLPEIISLLEDEDDRETVHACVDVLESIIRLYGMLVLQIGGEKKKEQIGKRLHKILMLMLQEKHISQQPDEETADDPSSSSSSSSPATQETKEIIVDREEIFEYVTDLIETLTKVCGALYLPSLQKLLPWLIKFIRPERAAGMRGTAVGCLATFATELKADFEPFLPSVFPAVMAGLADPEASVRRNAAFAVGCLLQIPGSTLLTQYPTIVQALKQIYTQIQTAPHETANTSNGVSPSSASPLVADSSHVSSVIDELLACRDNACAAFAKMISALIERGRSVSTPFFPELIQYLIAGLPSQSDHQESIYTYPCIISLYKHHLALIAPYTPQVISIFSQVFGNPDVDASVQTDMIAFCRALLQSDNAAAVHQVVASLPEKQQQQFQKFVMQGPTDPASTTMNGQMNGQMNGDKV